jgi:hypothetical protein
MSPFGVTRKKGIIATVRLNISGDFCVTITVEDVGIFLQQVCGRDLAAVTRGFFGRRRKALGLFDCRHGIAMLLNRSRNERHSRTC